MSLRIAGLVLGLAGCAAQMPTLSVCPAIESTDMVEPLTVEVFDVGTYPGPLGQPLHMKLRDLDQMVANFYRLQRFIKVPIRLGHGAGVINGTGRGDPALGWVLDVERQGTKLIARVTGMPRVVRELIARGRYRRVSIEWWVEWEASFDETNLRSGARGYVLTAVTLLGADLPQVKTLKDLAYYL